jgi:hypothetical protein
MEKADSAILMLYHNNGVGQLEIVLARFDLNLNTVLYNQMHPTIDNSGKRFNAEFTSNENFFLLYSSKATAVDRDFTGGTMSIPSGGHF